VTGQLQFHLVDHGPPLVEVVLQAAMAGLPVEDMCRRLPPPANCFMELTHQEIQGAFRS